MQEAHLEYRSPLLLPLRTRARVTNKPSLINLILANKPSCFFFSFYFFSPLYIYNDKSNQLETLRLFNKVTRVCLQLITLVTMRVGLSVWAATNFRLTHSVLSSP
jgi:hypothetical protein